MTTTQTTIAQYRQALEVLLKETFEQVHGYYLDKGTSLFETLETISAAEASRPVSARCASIAAQVEHTRFYLEVSTRYARGEEVGEIDWAASWRLTMVTPEEWQALKGRLHETLQELLVTLRTPVTWENEYAISGSMGVLAHTAYHLGEIRQALCTIKD